MPTLCYRLSLLAGLLLALTPGRPASAQGAPRQAVPVLLRPEYQSLCRGPLRWYGFFFVEKPEEWRETAVLGANAATEGAMWIPVPDAAAPFGCGYTLPVGEGRLAQTFQSGAPFEGLAPCLPTSSTTDSGCAWMLERREGQSGGWRVVARGRWTRVADNSFPEARFARQPTGSYRLTLSQPGGTWVGWWARSGNPYPAGQAFFGGTPRADMDFETRLLSAGRWQPLVASAEPHQAVRLGPSPLTAFRRLGLAACYYAGNWNNPGFPYYPDWFFARFPDVVQRDAQGKPFASGMFGKAVGAPNLEHPAVVLGTQRYLRAMARALRDAPNLAFWVMGGESLYATYMDAGRWSDYSAPSLDHFRAWLRARYSTVARLNAAWGSAFRQFETVDPPRAPSERRPWSDWLDFRFDAMAERFAWHYQALRSEDPRRLILSCNHGTIFHGNAYATMGWRPELYAACSDGAETGQIMEGTDSDCYNLLYTETLLGLEQPYAPVRLAYRDPNPRAVGGAKSFTPAAARRYLYESLGAGAWHAGFVQWTGILPDGEWQVKGTPAEKEFTRLFAEARRLGPLLEGMYPVRPSLAVFLSHRQWALRGYAPAWRAFHVAAIRQHIPKVYLSDGAARNGALDAYGTVLSMENDLVDPETADALLGYAHRGGHLLIVGRFAGQKARSERRPLGKGQVIRLAAADPESLASQLAGTHRLLDLAGAGTATLPATGETMNQAEVDNAEDLAAHASVGQTLRVRRAGLRALSLRMPTYYQKPQVGFTLEVYTGGVGGALLARKVYGGGITDNAWVRLDLPRAVPQGTRLYLRATPDPTLPMAHLGWWSTRRDVCPDGQAYVDDRPASGDRQVLLHYDEPLPAARVVEAFALSDGLSYGLALVNVSAQPVTVRLDPGRLIRRFGGRLEDYTVTCPLAPGVWSGGALRLTGGGSAFLLARYRAGQQEMARLLRRAADAVAQWRRRGAATESAVWALAQAQQAARKGWRERACGLALRALSQPGLAVSAIVRNRRLRVVGRLWDAEGRPLHGAVVMAEFTPTCGFTRPLKPEGPGRYNLDLPLRSLPPVYDPVRRRYVPFRGPLRLMVHARRGAQVTGRMLDLAIPAALP